MTKDKAKTEYPRDKAIGKKGGNAQSCIHDSRIAVHNRSAAQLAAVAMRNVSGEPKNAEGEEGKYRQPSRHGLCCDSNSCCRQVQGAVAGRCVRRLFLLLLFAAAGVLLSPGTPQSAFALQPDIATQRIACLLNL